MKGEKPRTQSSKRIPPRCEFNLDRLVLKIDKVLPSDVQVIEDVVDEIVGLVGQMGCAEGVADVGLALREALANAILHGNRSSPEAAVRLCVALQKNCGMLIIVKDAGSGFDPGRLPNPVFGGNLLSAHGRGIFLINQLMDDVRFRFEHGTEIYMRRDPHPAATPGAGPEPRPSPGGARDQE